MTDNTFNLGARMRANLGRAASPETQSSNHYIQFYAKIRNISQLERLVLFALLAVPIEQTLGELSKITDLDTGAAQRTAQRLAEQGLAREVDAGTWRAAPLFPSFYYRMHEETARVRKETS